MATDASDPAKDCEGGRAGKGGGMRMRPRGERATLKGEKGGNSQVKVSSLSLYSHLETTAKGCVYLSQSMEGVELQLIQKEGWKFSSEKSTTTHSLTDFFPRTKPTSDISQGW